MGCGPAASHQFFGMLLISSRILWGFPSVSPPKVLHPELVGRGSGGLWSSWPSLAALGAEAGEYRGDDGFCPAGIGWCPTKHSHSRNSSRSLGLYFACILFKVQPGQILLVLWGLRWLMSLHRTGLSCVRKGRWPETMENWRNGKAGRTSGLDNCAWRQAGCASPRDWQGAVLREQSKLDDYVLIS